MNQNHRLQASTELLDMFNKFYQWEQSQSLLKKIFETRMKLEQKVIQMKHCSSFNLFEQYLLEEIDE